MAALLSDRIKTQECVLTNIKHPPQKKKKPKMFDLFEKI